MKENQELITLIEMLKEKSREEDVRVWRDIAIRLEKPRRNYANVNIGKINRYSRDNDTIVVPGKVLGSGMLGHPVILAALDFSAQARKKIGEGKCLSIEELMKENPKGSGVRVIK
jgi:large subunit ribosomal protein L18e